MGSDRFFPLRRSALTSQPVETSSAQACAGLGRTHVDSRPYSGFAWQRVALLSPLPNNPPGNALATWRAFGRAGRRWAGSHLRERPALPGLRPRASPGGEGLYPPLGCSVLAWRQLRRLERLRPRRPAVDRTPEDWRGLPARPGLRRAEWGCTLPCVARPWPDDARAAWRDFNCAGL